MNILTMTDEEFEHEIAPYGELIKQCARKARLDTRELVDKWEQDLILNPLTPDPLSVLWGINQSEPLAQADSHTGQTPSRLSF